MELLDNATLLLPWGLEWNVFLELDWYSRISARFIKINKVEHEVAEREGEGIIIKILILIRKFRFKYEHSLEHEAWEKIINTINYLRKKKNFVWCDLLSLLEVWRWPTKKYLQTSRSRLDVSSPAYSVYFDWRPARLSYIAGGQTLHLSHHYRASDHTDHASIEQVQVSNSLVLYFIKMLLRFVYSFKQLLSSNQKLKEVFEIKSNLIDIVDRALSGFCDYWIGYQLTQYQYQ